MSFRLLTAGLAAALLALFAADAPKTYPTGYADTEFLPGGKWRVHDDSRPRPPVVAPGTASAPERPGKAPSDAVVLFDGTDLSHWVQRKRGGGTLPPAWKGRERLHGGRARYRQPLHQGEVRRRPTAHRVGDSGESRALQPGAGQLGRAAHGLYEIQVLDSYDNVSYADGQAGSIYGQYPPLVNASRKPGEWQTYDIVFEAPRFAGGESGQTGIRGPCSTTGCYCTTVRK